MNRNVDELTVKARKHVVYSSPGGQRFVVESGSSGELYRVSQHENGVSYGCTCAWTEHNPGSECSHVLAVRMAVIPTG